MKHIVRVFFLLCFNQYMLSAPLIQKITNDSDFGMLVLYHSDDSSCSLQGKAIIIEPHATFTHEFLLEIGEPSLVLRPVFYRSMQGGHDYWFVDEQSHEVNNSLIQQAYEGWLKDSKNYRYKKNAQLWFDNWVGKDISIVPHEVEMLGYLLNLSRVVIYNNRAQHVQWLSFSKGIFSKLILEFQIQQHRRRGVRAKVVVKHGEGGICTQGVVEHL